MRNVRNIDIMTESEIINKRIRSGNIAHAYIIEHRDESRLEKFAEDFIDALGVEIADVYYAEKSGKKDYLAEDVEAMIARLSLNPYGDRNMGIVRKADDINPVGQNKLLKTLEEPSPGTVILLLCCNRYNLLQTVRSRCVFIPLPETDNEAERESTERIYGDERISKGVKLICEKNPFHKFRDYLEKEVTDQTTAQLLLDEIERSCGDSVFAVRQAETARMDMIQGMGYKHALKRLFLEFEQIRRN